MTPSAGLSSAERLVRIEVGVEGGYVYGSGFVVRPEVVLTCAHVVTAGRTVAAVDLHGARHAVPCGPDAIWTPGPDGPDLALLRVPGLGAGLRTFPVARLDRVGTDLAPLDGVDVWGCPAFAETNRGLSFCERGSLLRASQLESGLVEVRLPPVTDGDPGGARTRGFLHPPNSAWDGMSGGPVIVRDHLVGVVVEHAPRTGRLLCAPLTLLEPDRAWPQWGPGVPDPQRWWRLLGVPDHAAAPVLPGNGASAGWLDDLRAVHDELRQNPRVPEAARRPGTFAIQLYEVLERAFATADPQDPGAAAQRIHTELTRSEAAGPVYRVAASRPLSAGVLRQLLDELARVHSTVAALPRASARLRYRIEAPRIAVADPHAEMRRWLTDMLAGQPTDELEDAERTLHDLIDRVDLHPGADPQGRLIALLHNGGWAQPAARAPKLVSEIFASGLGEHPEQLLRTTLGEAGPAPVVMMTGRDRAPEHVVPRPGGVLVNQKPTLAHLREGFFAPTGAIDEVERAYWAWYEDVILADAGQLAGRLPMFWVTGPSGAGKSILLLQLLARLNARAGVSVLCPAGGSHLSDAARHADGLGRTRHVVIGVDDPLTVGDGQGPDPWRQAFDILAHRLQTEPVSGLPVFVCCAPTEQRAMFERRHGEVVTGGYRHDGYDTTLREQLRDWYALRTGTPAPALPEGGVPLPAQLFFEWRNNGEGITAYARRFRSRVTATNSPELYGFFVDLLAVNRLDVGYPEESFHLLPAEVRDALDGYGTDLHVLPSDDGRPGYRLAHPLLAGLMYDVWFPVAGHAAVRREHLRDALLGAVRVNPRGWASLPLLRVLLAAVTRAALSQHPTETAGHADGPDAASPLSRLDAEAAVLAAAEAIGADLTRLAHPVLAVWVGLERQVRFARGWSPMAHALHRLTTSADTDVGLTDLVDALVRLRDPVADRAVWAFLRAKRSWPAWHSTARRLVERRPDDGDLDVLVETTAGRVDGDALQTLVAVLRQPWSYRPLLEVAHRLVRGGIATDGPLAPLVAALHRRGGDHQGVVHGWLAGPPHREQALVWRQILAAPVPVDLLPALGAWMRSFPTDIGTGHALARLVSWPWFLRGGWRRDVLRAHLERHGELCPPLRDRLVGLLTADHPAWSLLFVQLRAAHVRQPEIRAAAIDWLDRNPGSTRWPRVYSHLCLNMVEPDDGLVGRGADRLTGGLDALHCADVFVGMLRVAPPARRAEVADTALLWLTRYPDEETAWGDLASRIARATAPEHRERTARTLLDWVRAHPASGRAAQLLQVATTASAGTPAEPAVLVHAERWLGVPRPAWGAVYAAIRPSLPVDRARALALPWLLTEMTDKRWAGVLAATAGDLDSTHLGELVHRWFSAADTYEFSAGPLWRIAIHEGPCRHLLRDREFRVVVANWLRRNGTRPSWALIAKDLISGDPTDLDVVGAAVESNAPVDQAYGVIDRIVEEWQARPELLAAAQRELITWQRTEVWAVLWRWLISVAPSEAAWRFSRELLPGLAAEVFAPLWVRLWDAYPDEVHRAHLRPLAQPRLDAAPATGAWNRVRSRLADRPSPPGLPAPGPASTRLVGPRPGSPPPAPDNPPAGHWRRPLTCAGCRAPFVLQGNGAHPAVKSFTCQGCASDLNIDIRTGRVAVAQRLTRLPAPAAQVRGSRRNPRPRVHCDRCDTTLDADISSVDGGALAVDRGCGYLYEIPPDLLADLVAHGRYASRPAD
ncbi:serine protease [Micromonospora sp. NPDC049171]|uniref:serine protease n=1 Tax=Micromonospora sp. NPDC049171 TaxID=3155770 RepID=UPI0033E33239